VDLFLGGPTRAHEDVDVAILRRDAPVLRAHLEGWDVRTATRGRPGRLDPWPVDAPLDPRAHEVHARRDAGRPAEIEFLAEEAESDMWTYRRNPAVARPLRRIGVRSRGGIPFLRPEIVLLYKATRPEEPRNASDFARLRDALAPAQADWLASALRTAHPECPWGSELAAARPLSNRRTFVRHL
jgi:hypothetical protein